MDETLVDSWRIHNRINLYMLAAIVEEALMAPAPGKGKSVYQLFAHMHYVRLMWLKACAPDLLQGIDKLEGEGTRETLAAALEASAGALAALIERSIANGGKVKNFKPNVTAFVCYLVAHDAHHRGQMTVLLKQLGHPLDSKTDYGMWEWGTR